ncbi:MAG: HAD-IB family hydrolase [Deltaproteobacteria bacterium]|nr:HAD-IB family hydrolase [Deltaproteobacteria bacterium]
MSELAFFDFDKTLVRKESGELIAVPVGLRGLVHPWQGARFIGLGLLYKMGRVSREEMQYVGYATYRGGRLDRLIETLDAIWERWIEPGLSPAVLARLRLHQSNNDGTYVLTASPTYVAAPAKRVLGVDGVIGTRMEVRDDGRLSGVPIEPLMQGEEKARVVREIANAHGVDLADCWGYSDSMADMEMLDVVGHPVAVDPDPELRELARSRGWEVLGHDDIPAGAK